MAFTVDTDDLGALSDPPAPGEYHIAFTEVDEEGGNSGEMVVEMEVLAGTIEGMEGRTHRMYYPHTTNFSKFIHRLALVSGLVTQEQLEAAKKEGAGIEYDFSKIVGRQAMIRLHEDEYQGSKRLKMAPFHIWSVEDPTCARWPKHEKMLKKAGYTVDKPAKSEPAKSGKSELDDLVL